MTTATGRSLRTALRVALPAVAAVLVLSGCVPAPVDHSHSEPIESTANFEDDSVQVEDDWCSPRAPSPADFGTDRARNGQGYSCTQDTSGDEALPQREPCSYLTGEGGCDFDVPEREPCNYLTGEGGCDFEVPEREPCNFLTGEGGCGPDESQEACLIKGNISYNTGERIYHLPGQEYYDETVINSSEGERWFCTEDEAVAAGWRASYL